MRGRQSAVSHDDESAVSRARVTERGGDRGRLALAGVDEHVDARRSQLGLRCHDERHLDGLACLTGGENIRQHPADEGCSLVRPELRREARLRPVERLDRNDCEHAREHTYATLWSVPPQTITVLAGGLGGSRLVDAFTRALGPDRVTAIVNVGDDLEFLGLHISPDLDTVLYTLAGLLDDDRGWGVRDETYSARATAEALGAESWFTLGDRDIGLHLVRTAALRAGEPLSAVTARLAERLGVGVRLLPATDGDLRTFVLTDAGEFDFQTWFVRRRHADRVLGVAYRGEGRPVLGVLDAIRDADLVVIAPSNPFVSVGPILAIQGVRAALAARRVAAVSPIVGGVALRGPLADMLESLGFERSARGVSDYYGDLVSAFVLDPADAELASAIPGAVVAPVVMVEPDSRAEVGTAILEALR